MNTKFLPALVLLVLLLLSVMWVILRSGGADEGAGTEAATALPPAELTGEEGDATRLPRELTVPDREEGRSEAALVSRHDTPREIAAGGVQSFDLEGAGWVEVSIQLPATCPEDPTLDLIAVFPPENTPFEAMGLPYIVSQIAAADSREEGIAFGIPWHLDRVPETLTMRVPHPADAVRGYFCLRGRYVSFDSERHELPVASPDTGDTGDLGEIVLTPELGAWLTGRFLLPPEAADREIVADHFHLGVTSQPRENAASSEGADTASFFLSLQGLPAEVYDDLTFEVRGLDVDRIHTLNLQVERLLDHEEAEIEVTPGEHRRLDIALLPGASLLGRAVDEQGEGIAQARLRIRGAGGGRGFGRNSLRTSVFSDEEGRYALHGLSAASFTLRGNVDGYLDPEEEEIELADGQVIENHLVLFRRGNAVAGIVRWPGGEAAAGAEVKVYDASVGELAGELIGADRTTEEGRFEVTGLQGGPFLIVALALQESEEGPLVPETTETRSGGNRAFTRQFAAIEPPDPYLDRRGVRHRSLLEEVASESMDLELVLVPALEFSGSVVDDTGAPVELFEVTVSPRPIEEGWNPETVSLSFESPEGTFTLAGVFAGDWSVRASAEGYTDSEEEIPIAIPFTGEPVLLVLSRRGTLSGIVVDPAGAPIADATVTLEDGDALPAAFRFSMRDPSTTDAEGRFTLEGVAPTACSLLARHGDWAVSESVVVEPVAGERIDDIVLRLRVGARITGEVFDEEGRPVAGKDVTCGAGMYNMGFGEGGTKTDEAGFFQFDHVDPGKVTVIARPSNEELFAGMAGAEDESAAVALFGSMLMEKVEVADGEEVHVILGSEPKVPVRVFGRVTEAGVPLTDGGLYVIAEGGALIEGMKMATIDEQGDYEVVVDRPGDYVFNFSPEGMGMGGSAFYATVPSEPEYRFDLEIPAGWISGRVFAPDGSPASGISLQISLEGGIMSIADLDQSRRESTEADGSFRFPSLERGTYSIQVGGSTGFFGMGGSDRYGASVVSGITVGEDEAVEGIEIHLSDAGALTGTIRDAGGHPVAGAAVFVRDAAGRLIAGVSSVLSDATGSYHHEGIAPGVVTVSAQKDDLTCAEVGPVSIVEGEASEQDLRLAPGTTLDISLLEDGEPVRARVRVVNEQGLQVNGRFSIADFENLITDGFNSRVRTVGPLPPGKYTVYAGTDDGKDAKRTVRAKEGQARRKVTLRLK
jgi:protocatechuate 3,4-dioxygenase beta subunit